MLAVIEPVGFSLLPISREHAVKVRELPPLHRAPFDHMLLAQALGDPSLLLTHDELLRSYGTFEVMN